MTPVETTPADIQDVQVTERIQQMLIDKEWPPEQPIIDSGYMDAELLATSQTVHHIDLLGPTVQTPVGKLKPVKGLMEHISAWTGKTSKSPVRKVNAVNVGPALTILPPTP